VASQGRQNHFTPQGLAQPLRVGTTRAPIIDGTATLTGELHWPVCASPARTAQTVARRRKFFLKFSCLWKGLFPKQSQKNNPSVGICFAFIVLAGGDFRGGSGSLLEKSSNLAYAHSGFGRAGNRSGRKSGEESPNTAGHDAA